MASFRPKIACAIGLTAVAVLAGCRGGAPGALPNAVPQSGSREQPRVPQGRLGALLTTKDGGQIFGFDINQNGSDGAFATSKTTNKPGVFTVTMDTFDQDTGAIVNTFAAATGSVNSYAFDRILAGDVGFVTHFVVPKGQIFAQHFYATMNPVTAGKFTGKWSPPVTNLNVEQTASNQATAENALMANDPKTGSPELIVTDIAANKIQKIIPLDPNVFVGGNGPILAQDSAANKAVIVLSPDGGAVRQPPIPTQTVLIDLATGKNTLFSGFNNGPFGPGYPNGNAVDSTTHVEATTTELNAQVEFYDLTKQTGIAAAQLPCTDNQSQTLSGAGIAADSKNHLFLVSVPTYGCSSGSAILVYNEKGTLVETITGFTFFLAEPPAAINPSKRMGWAFGPGPDQLQQFFY